MVLVGKTLKSMLKMMWSTGHVIGALYHLINQTIAKTYMKQTGKAFMLIQSRKSKQLKRSIDSSFEHK